MHAYFYRLSPTPISLYPTKQHYIEGMPPQSEGAHLLRSAVLWGILLVSHSCIMLHFIRCI